MDSMSYSASANVHFRPIADIQNLGGHRVRAHARPAHADEGQVARRDGSKGYAVRGC